MVSNIIFKLYNGSLPNSNAVNSLSIESMIGATNAGGT